MLYNVVLASAVQWSESAMSTHRWIPSCATLPHPPIPLIREHWAELPELHNSFPLASYFIHCSIYMSIQLSQFVPPSPSTPVSARSFFGLGFREQRAGPKRAPLPLPLKKNFFWLCCVACGVEQGENNGVGIYEQDPSRGVILRQKFIPCEEARISNTPEECALGSGNSKCKVPGAYWGTAGRR